MSQSEPNASASPVEYYWSNGSLKWGHPIDVGHLILQLQTLDPAMKVSSVTFIDMPTGRKPRAYGLSMSYERWNELGWLDFTLPGPQCLAIWATQPEDSSYLNADQHSATGATKEGQ